MSSAKEYRKRDRSGGGGERLSPHSHVLLQWARGRKRREREKDKDRATTDRRDRRMHYLIHREKRQSEGADVARVGESPSSWRWS